MNEQTKWIDLLNRAVSEPGLILKAYSSFHGYSLSNQIAAVIQCKMRGIEPGPINTYPGWQRLNRQVRKGERALTLCMPLASKRENERGETEQFIKAFVWKPRWFVLSQTEGEPVPMPEIPEWDKARALESLGVTQVEFSEMNGNVQGYAVKRQIAISPLAVMPWKTTFHELAHVILGHTEEADFHDDDRTPRNLREVEAEATAMLVLESLELPGSEYARGYIQHWISGDVIPEKTAQKIFGAADRILRAGREQAANTH